MSRSTSSNRSAGEMQDEGVRQRLRRRYRVERLFRAGGLLAIGFALLALLMLLGSVGYSASSVLTQAQVRLDVQLDAADLDPLGDGSAASFAQGNPARVLRDSLKTLFPDVNGRRERRALSRLLSVGAEYAVLDAVEEDPSLLGTTQSLQLPLSADVDLYLKGEIRRDVPESDRKLSDSQLDWIDTMVGQGRVEEVWNLRFLTDGDSREPELAGTQGAIRGSLLTLLVTLVLSFPMGVAAAVYLEEFAPKNRFTDIVEVNINNLAAVPSIIFGLLGLAVFLNLFGLPRSAPLVGGLVLALMTLPTIIIAGRAALSAVPPSIREAALGVGASPTQAVLHHVLPQALPGILTGTIIGMARALGETAPLLMIGMVAFIADLPTGFSDPSTVLPVQIFLWNDAPERAFQARTSAAIVVLLGFLILMNAFAVWVRSRFETRY
jgi:phosphate transport system permease protein